MSRRIEEALAHLTTAVPTISVTKTVGDAKTQIEINITNYETIHYTYLIDANERLCGVVSIKELIAFDSRTPLEQFCSKTLVTARRHSNAARVAYLALRHNISAVPIVDQNHRFLGIVTADDIQAILNHEHSKSILRLAGVRSDHTPGSLILAGQPSVQIKARLPWLILGLGGGLLAAIVVGQYEEALSSHIILAAFIPAIVYIADSVGAQTQMIFIRALALDQTLSIKNYVKREVVVNIMLASILGTTILIVTSIWQQSLLLGMILGISVFLTVAVSVVVAIMLPYLSLKLHKDPAVASGPLETVCRDIISIIIYLTIAGTLIQYV